MIDLDTLNPQQRQGVVNYNGPTLILAGAGTGKTRVITTRIAYMVKNGIEPTSIAAMTFTNKAAKEMRERIIAIIGKGVAKEISISTFHSFCLNILRKNPEAAGLEPGFSLAGTSDQVDLVRKALDETGWGTTYKAENLLFEIGICKNWLLTPEDLANGKKPGQGIEDPAVLAKVYELYERQLRLHHAIDFDDCILKTIFALRNSPELKNRMREKLKYILVDEFQDTNFSQFAVLEEITSSEANICVVGDDDQSIYSWRGAMYETLEKFKKTFEGTNVIKLEQNYRCTNVILDAANAVIKNNSKRMDKKLWSSKEDMTPIVSAVLPDAVEEARWISGKCIEALGAGYKPKDIAILYRSNAQAKFIEMALRESALPYKTFGGQSFFERKEVKDFLSYLRLIFKPSDPIALWRVINTPPRGIGLVSQEKLSEISKAKKISPFKAIGTEEFTKEAGRAHMGALDFVEKINELRTHKLTAPDDFLTLGTEILKYFSLENYVRTHHKNPATRQMKVEGLRALPKWLHSSAQQMLHEEGHHDALELLDKLSLTELPLVKDDEEANYISLMTIHGSKGLEYPVVFVVGLEEGLLPHKNSQTSPQEIAEERRLFYVALTRAKTKLHLSYALSRQTGFQKEGRRASRFLLEMPEGSTDLRDIKAKQKSMEEQEDERKQRTVSAFAKMREQFSTKKP